MSKIQQRTKSHLIPLIADDWSQISMYTAEALAAWAAMFTMVVEFADENTLATGNDERKWLRIEGTPPPNWRIFVGRYAGIKWSGTFNHFGFDREKRPVDISDGDGGAEMLDTGIRSQSTAFVVGRLFLMTASTKVTERQIDRSHLSHGCDLRTIWPKTNRLLTRPDKVLDDYEADAVSRSLMPDEMQPYIRHAWEAPE